MQDFDSLHNITPGKHIYQFYKDVDGFLQLMIPFFRSGLSKAQACLWLVSERKNLDHIRRNAKEALFYGTPKVRSSQFQILSAEEWYLSDGNFDESKALLNAKNYLQMIRQDGYSTLRIAGDCGCISRKDWPLFYAYEQKAHQLIKDELLIALCAYPIMNCTPSQAKGILETHEDVLIGYF